MKKLIYTLFVVIAVSSFSYAQEISDVAVSNGSTELVKSKTSGEYEFILPSRLTKEDITNNSKYYTHYFAVTFDEASHKASIKMASNNDKSRFVIARFLAACKVDTVKVDDDNVSISDFIENYLK